MTDWSSEMQQTFEYCVVDPKTWRDIRPIRTVKSSTINRDAESETLGSASFDVTEPLGECYVRVYLVTIQNGIEDRHPLGTFLVQTPSSSFDGKVKSVTVDAYTPLLELKEDPPPLGYSILKGANIMDNAYMIVREHMRAPVVKTSCDTKLYSDFVANADDTWLLFLRDLISNAKYDFNLDEMGRVLFAPRQDTASLEAVWTYDTGNSSILYPELSLDRDLYGIPNTIEVIYSKNGENYYAKAVNDDENSPVSVVNRGRVITRRIIDPDMIGDPSKNQIEEYAKNALRQYSTLQQTISYTHGYCPVRIGDCVRLNYPAAGLNGVKARVISQSIKCEPGCPVSEKAIFTSKLWR